MNSSVVARTYGLGGLGTRVRRDPPGAYIASAGRREEDSNSRVDDLLSAYAVSICSASEA